MYCSIDQIFDSKLDQQERDDRRDEDIINRANDKLAALPEFYRDSSGKKRFTNIDDAWGEVSQESLIQIARMLRDNKLEEIGQVLRDAIMKNLLREAENDLDEYEEKGTW